MNRGLTQGARSGCVADSCLVTGKHNWRDDGDPSYKPRRGLFGQKTWRNHTHCGKKAYRVKVVQGQKCASCSSVREVVVSKEAAFCSSCGTAGTFWGPGPY